MKYLIDPEKLRDDLIAVGKETGDKLAARGAYITNMVDHMLRGNDLPGWAVSAEKNKVKPGGYSDEFEAFWEAYPSRGGVKSGKAPAFKAWQKLAKEPGLLQKCLDALRWQKCTEQWKENNGHFIPMATTYLNQRRFEDEMPEEAKQALAAHKEAKSAVMDWEGYE